MKAAIFDNPDLFEVAIIPNEDRTSDQLAYSEKWATLNALIRSEGGGKHAMVRAIKRKSDGACAIYVPQGSNTLKLLCLDKNFDEWLNAAKTDDEGWLVELMERAYAEDFPKTCRTHDSPKRGRAR